MSDEEIAEKAETLLSLGVIRGLSESNWKTHLAAVEQFCSVRTIDPAEVSSQLLRKIINKKPGLKDTNVQVAKLRLECVLKILLSISLLQVAMSMSCVLLDVLECLNDPKLSPLVAECLTAFSEATKLDIVSSDVLGFALNSQKSPKVQMEVLSWLSNAI